MPMPPVDTVVDEAIAPESRCRCRRARSACDQGRMRLRRLPLHRSVRSAGRAERRILVRRRRLRHAGRRAGRLDDRRPGTGRRHQPLRHGRWPRRRDAQQSRVHLRAAIRRGAARRSSRSPTSSRCSSTRRSKNSRRPRRPRRCRRLSRSSGTRWRSTSASSRPACSGNGSRPAAWRICRRRWTRTTRSPRTRISTIIRTGEVSDAEKPLVERSSQAAIAWTGVQAPQVVFGVKQAHAEVGVRQPGDRLPNRRARIIRGCGS